MLSAYPACFIKEGNGYVESSGCIVLIEDGLSQQERLIRLNSIAIHQMSILENRKNSNYLK